MPSTWLPPSLEAGLLSILQEETKERGAFPSDTEKGKEDAHFFMFVGASYCAGIVYAFSKEKEKHIPCKHALVDPRWHNKTAK